MAWPDDEDLPIVVEAAWGADVLTDPGTWTWTDLSDRIRAVPITLRAGRSSGAAVVSPSTATITLANEDGALTPLSGMSPWWPDVDLGTPIRLRLWWGGVWHILLAGFADSWSATVIPTTEPGVVESAVKVTISGPLRRFGQGEQPARSALRRTIAASALAYWPAEDGDSASLAGSAMPGHPPLTVGGGGSLSFGEITNIVTGAAGSFGTDRLADLSGGAALSALVPADVTAATATASGWSALVTSQLYSTAAITGDVVLLEVDTPGGTYVRWRLLAVTAGGPNFGVRVVAYSAAGAATQVTPAFGIGTSFTRYNMSVWQDGPNISVGMRWMDTAWEATGSLPGTVAGVTRLGVNTLAATSTQPMPIGHLALWAGQPYPINDVPGDGYDAYPGSHLSAFGAWRWEPAHVRLARLAAEDGLTVTMPAVAPDEATRMGLQHSGTAEALYAQAVEADGGILYESGYGLAYLPRTARYNQTPALTIDLATYCVAAGDSPRVLAPVLDDRDARNEWTVSRTDGASATAADLEHQRRHGIRQDSVELNLADDSPLRDQAAWRVHLGIAQGLQDTVPLDLAANPDLVDAWLTCQVGSRIRRIHAPAQAGPVDDRIIDGWSATIGPRKWTLAVATSPAGPWDVAEADGEQRAAADGSTLAVPLSAGTMTMTIASTASNGPWTWAVDAYPLPTRVGGEVLVIGAPGEVLVDNPWMSTSTSGWSGSNAALAWSTAADPTPYGSGAARITPTGSATNAGLRDQQHVPVTGGAEYRAMLWAYAPAGWAAGGGIGPAVDWYDASDASLSTSTLTMAPVPAGVWTPLSALVTAPATAAYAAVRGRQAGSPTAADVWYATGITLVATSTYLTSPQTMTISQRGVNGVQRAWLVGTEVDVAHPAIIPL